jgi:hypothetical protein
VSQETNHFPGVICGLMRSFIEEACPFFALFCIGRNFIVQEVRVQGHWIQCAMVESHRLPLGKAAEEFFVKGGKILSRRQHFSRDAIGFQKGIEGRDQIVRGADAGIFGFGELERFFHQPCIHYQRVRLAHKPVMRDVAMKRGALFPRELVLGIFDERGHFEDLTVFGIQAGGFQVNADVFHLVDGETTYDSLENKAHDI